MTALGATATAATSAAIGIAIGLSLAAPPGPMNALIARESTRRGARHGLRVGLAAPIVDTFYLGVLLLGLGKALQRYQRVAAVLGALLMGYLAILTARPEGLPEPGRDAERPPGFWTVLLLSLGNPFQIAWWLTAGSVFMATRGVWGVIGFLAGIYAWVVVFSLLMSRGALRWGWFTPLTTVLSADLLFVFGILVGAQA